jgi:thioredoxin-dependent peroxiredoxin
MNATPSFLILSLLAAAAAQAPATQPNGSPAPAAAAPSAPPQAARPTVGQAAPSFSAASTADKTVTLADFKGKQTLVLAFFPKAFTGGCTKEMSGLRDRFKEFQEAGAQVMGISRDTLDIQKNFATSLTLPFPLLADPDGTVARAYGVDMGPYAARVTFVIGSDGKVKQVIEGKDAIDPAGALSACPRKAKT